MTTPDILLELAPPDRPVVIAGPTASGKSALALCFAERQGRTVVNADAMQVYGCWRVLTARPGPADTARAPHALYGHVAAAAPYSVGDWLREVAPLLDTPIAPVIVGGTGLYLSALTEGLADIPATAPETRALSDARLARDGASTLAAELDRETRARIDLANPRRVQRAWEVQAQTGRGMAAWQARAHSALLPRDTALKLCLVAEKPWLSPRIAARLDAMMRAGAREEVAAMAPIWSPDLPAAKAIGAAELMAAHRGEVSESDALAAAATQTIRYAKRQRTWFRRRMAQWRPLDAARISEELKQHAARTR